MIHSIRLLCDVRVCFASKLTTQEMGCFGRHRKLYRLSSIKAPNGEVAEWPCDDKGYTKMSLLGGIAGSEFCIRIPSCATELMPCGVVARSTLELSTINFAFCALATETNKFPSSSPFYDDALKWKISLQRLKTAALLRGH